MKLLIDECLSPDLVTVAVSKGHPGKALMWSGWVRPAGRIGDTNLSLLGGDWTFVTRNSVDFRGHTDRPSSKGQYADVSLDAG